MPDAAYFAEHRAAEAHQLQQQQATARHEMETLTADQRRAVASAAHGEQEARQRLGDAQRALDAHKATPPTVEAMDAWARTGAELLLKVQGFEMLHREAAAGLQRTQERLAKLQFEIYQRLTNEFQARFQAEYQRVMQEIAEAQRNVEAVKAAGNLRLNKLADEYRFLGSIPAQLSRPS